MEYYKKISWLLDYWPLPIGIVDSSLPRLLVCAAISVLIYFLRRDKFKNEAAAISALIEKGAKTISYGRWSVTAASGARRKKK